MTRLGIFNIVQHDTCILLFNVNIMALLVVALQVKNI